MVLKIPSYLFSVSKPWFGILDIKRDQIVEKLFLTGCWSFLAVKFKNTNILSPGFFAKKKSYIAGLVEKRKFWILKCKHAL